MTVTLEPALGETHEAGVIEEARTRQRRHRGGVAAATVVAAAIALLLALAGGAGKPRLGSPSAHPERPRPAAAGRSLSSCASSSGTALSGAPSKSLLSILGVLRRPATAADSASAVSARGQVQDVFVNYIRRARVVDGSPYYIYPAILGGCGTGEKLHEGMMELAS